MEISADVREAVVHRGASLRCAIQIHVQFTLRKQTNKHKRVKRKVRRLLLGRGEIRTFLKEVYFQSHGGGVFARVMKCGRSSCVSCRRTMQSSDYKVAYTENERLDDEPVE